jgi:site-specific recombinase XerD
VKAAAVGLPDSITDYAMRHSVITDLVTGGLDLMTIAQLSGTSIAMLEKHYSHLRAAHAADALATLALKFRYDLVLRYDIKYYYES